MTNDTLFSINPLTNQVVEHELDFDNNRSKFPPHLYSLYTDRYKNLWVATTQGAQIIKRSKNAISNLGRNQENLKDIVNTITSFDDALWFSIDNQLYRQHTGKHAELVQEFDATIYQLLVLPGRLLILLAISDKESELYQWSNDSQSAQSIKAWKDSKAHIISERFGFENSIVYLTMNKTLAQFTLEGSIK